MDNSETLDKLIEASDTLAEVSLSELADVLGNADAAELAHAGHIISTIRQRLALIETGGLRQHQAR